MIHTFCVSPYFSAIMDAPYEQSPPPIRWDVYSEVCWWLVLNAFDIFPLLFQRILPYVDDSASVNVQLWNKGQFRQMTDAETQTETINMNSSSDTPNTNERSDNPSHWKYNRGQKVYESQRILQWQPLYLSQEISNGGKIDDYRHKTFHFPAFLFSIQNPYNWMRYGRSRDGATNKSKHKQKPQTLPSKAQWFVLSKRNVNWKSHSVNKKKTNPEKLFCEKSKIKN